MVAFYSRFQNAVMAYNIALFPFDAIELAQGHRGLCPPGLGTIHYRDMAAALFTTLQADFLPTEDRTSNIFSMLENSTRDGYVLLWHMFTLVVPVFEPSHRVDVPDWFEENQCVFQFAQAFLLYFRMQHKRKELVTLRDKSILFLRGIAADHAMVTSLLTMVLSSHHVPAGSLPHDLLIPQLATTISNSLDAAGRNRHTPRRANKTIESPPTEL